MSDNKVKAKMTRYPQEPQNKGETMATIEDVNDNNFEQIVLKSEVPVVVDFWAQWCGPCRKLTPVLEQIQNEFNNSIKMVKIDTDKNTATAKEYGIASLPSVLLFKDGKVQEMMVGIMPKSAIITNIKKLLN